MIKKFMKTFMRNEDGQGLLEYALLATLLVIVIIAVMRSLGKTTEGKFKKIDQELKKG